MIRCMVGLTAALIIMTSQANTTIGPTSTHATITITGYQVRTVTKSAQVHANVPKIPKYKILRSNPHRITHRILKDSDDDFIDDDELATPYRRRDLNKIKLADDLPEHIRWQLFLGRQVALLKYRSKFGENMPETS